MLATPATFRLGDRLQARADALAARLEAGLPRLLLGWLVLAGAGCALRLGLEPGANWLPYLLLLLAPPLALAAGLRLFAPAAPSAAVVQHPLYGPGGLMLSLLLALLGAVAVRTAEYLTALPAIGAGAPAWLVGLHALLTVDALLLTSLYALAFAAALRRSSLFPMLLGVAWAGDLAVQLGIAWVAPQLSLPPAVFAALRDLLQGNSVRVLVSMAIWLPYLLLSARVAVTYRNRLPA